MFLRAVSQDALVEGTIIEINVTTPEGKNYCTNVKLKADDMELFDSFKSYAGIVSLHIFYSVGTY